MSSSWANTVGPYCDKDAQKTTLECMKHSRIRKVINLEGVIGGAMALGK